MKNVLSTSIILLILLASCGKKKPAESTKDYPKTVEFTYNGSVEVFNVIKKNYYLNGQGDSIDGGITKLWLDRNLGAKRVAISTNDSLASGDLFQWGRKADGHQLRTSDTVEQLSSTITPNHNKFIANPFGSDWLVNSNDSLWNTNLNLNCGCPDGWRVPTSEELLMEMNSWVTKDINGAFNSSLKWTSGGDRDNHGVIRYEDIWAFIWSSTPKNGNSALNLAIIGSSTAEVISTSRIYGMSVRCIKDY